MANKQVARIDDGWYGQGHTSDSDDGAKGLSRDNIKPDEHELPVSQPQYPQDTEVQNTKKFVLPMEPTEAVDKSREYPPIITVDGRVDTDIDHLMENPEEDMYSDNPAEDIPSNFPKPHVVRVIDGSLDDDIDNLMNHDGTMAHTLVDAPKRFHRGDLKEINAKKSPPNKKKDTLASPQTNRSFNKMNFDDSTEDNDITNSLPGSSDSKVVPYFERNNSSKAPTMSNDDADFCHLKQSLEEGFVLPPADLDAVTVATPSNKDNFPVFGSARYNREIQHFPEHKNDLCSGEQEIVENSNKTEEKARAENDIEPNLASDKAESTATDAGDVDSLENQNSDTPVDNISRVVEQLLKKMSKEELEERLGIETDALKKVEGVLDTITHPSASEQGPEKNKKENMPKADEPLEPSTVCVTANPDPQSPVSASMEATISLLKKSLDSIAKDSSETSQSSESQKLLAITALKLAGDSMTAASKMADALTLLVQNSQSTAAQNICNNFLKSGDTSLATKSELVEISSISKDHCQEDVKCETKEETVSSLTEREPKSKVIQKQQNDKRIQVEGFVAGDSNNIKEEKGAEGKTKVNKQEDDDSKLKDATLHNKSQRERYESKGYSKGDYRKIHNDRKRRDAQQNELNEEGRKRASRKTEEQLVEEDYIEKEDNPYNGSKGHQHHRDSIDRKRWEYNMQKKHRHRDNAEEFEYEQHYRKNYPESENMKEKYQYEMEVAKRRERERENKRSDREERHHKSKNSSQHRSKTPKRISTIKSPRDEIQIQNSNESHSPKRKPSTSSDCSPLKEEEFVRSGPWTLPSGEHIATSDCFFEKVVRHLKTCSPTREPSRSLDPAREYFRAKLVGSCVDPNCRDSDFDSIEFNANARVSESTRVHFDDEEEERFYYED